MILLVACTVLLWESSVITAFVKVVPLEFSLGKLMHFIQGPGLLVWQAFISFLQASPIVYNTLTCTRTT
jgi:hypothetical protein